MARFSRDAISDFRGSGNANPAGGFIDDQFAKFRQIADLIESASLSLSDKNSVLEVLQKYCPRLKTLKLKNFYTGSKKFSRVEKNAQVGIQINFLNSTLDRSSISPDFGKNMAVIVWESGEMETIL